MEKVEKYRVSVQALLKRYYEEIPTSEETETQFVCDTAHDHYQLINVGWHDEHRIYGKIIHIDINGEKIWIQYNGTEHPVAEELVGLGIPKDHIVLGFHSPYKRQFTEFAVN
jgi:hypothetical protein